MTDPLQVLAGACAHLVRQGYRFALVGGLAVAVRAEVRFTRDVDLAVGVEDDRNAEQLIFALSEAGYRPVASVEHETHGRLARGPCRGAARDALANALDETAIQKALTVRYRRRVRKDSPLSYDG